MVFEELAIKGLFLIQLERIEDPRGFFARSFCEEEFALKGLHIHYPQCNISFNREKGTVRGMHLQEAPHEEIKVVRCTKGAIYDVVIDLREGSKTYKRWVAVDLNETNRSMLYIPKGLAHGFQTLEDDSEVFYQMSSSFVPQAARGVRYNDPAFQISWPLPVSVISEKDEAYQSV